MTTSEARRIAYHEAGHAVMAWHLGSRRVIEVALTPGDLMHAGVCRSGPALITDKYLLAVHDILIHSAGHAAEAVLLGSAPPRSRASDSDKAQVLARRLQRGVTAGDQFFADLHAWARELIESPKLWPAVEYVAAALVSFGSLDGRCVEQVCRAALGIE